MNFKKKLRLLILSLHNILNNKQLTSTTKCKKFFSMETSAWEHF